MNPEGVTYYSTGGNPCVAILIEEMVSGTPKPLGEEHDVRRGVT